jgi:NitT/TauT family transport system substrate-binding protein
MRMFKTMAAALAITALASTPAWAADLEKKDVTVAVGGRVALYYLPLNIADLKGYFKEEGLNVEVVDFQGGSKSVQAVVGGSADVLSSAFEHMYVLKANSQDFTAISLMGRYPGFVLSVAPDLAKDWKGAASLKGKNVGVTSPGSSTNKMVDLLLLGAGLQPSDVSIIGIGAGPSTLAAFQNGTVQAAVQADPASTLFEKQGLAVPVVDTRTLEGTTEVYGGPMPAATISVPSDFVKKNPHTTQAIANAIVKALKFINESSPEEIVDVLPAEMLVGGDRDLYIEMLEKVKPSFSPDGVISEEAAETAYKAQKQYNPAVRDAGDMDVGSVYTNQFVNHANGS